MKQSNLHMAATFDKKWIKLNVGGAFFATFRTTLTKATPTKSPLHRIATNSTNVDWDRDEKGSFLIDRDPAYFQLVLNYLRTGHVVLGSEAPEEAVLLEAEYFNLPDLIKILKQRISERNRWSRPAYTNHHQLQLHHHHQQQQRQQQFQQQQLFMSQSLQQQQAKQRQHPLVIRFGENGDDGRDKWSK